MNLSEKTLTREYKFKGKVVNLRVDTAELPNGKSAGREVVEHNGGVGIVALNENKEVILVRQFRYPFMEELLEIPAGKKEVGEAPESCAARELKEETGAMADKLICLGEMYSSPGFCNEIIWLYLAINPDMGEKCPDEDEFLDTVIMPLDKAIEMIMKNEIKDAKTAMGILKTVEYLKNI